MSRKILSFLILLAIVVAGTSWRDQLQKLFDNDDLSEDDLLQELNKITLHIDREAKTKRKGIDLMNFAAQLKKLALYNGNAQPEVLTFLADKARSYQRQASKSILQQNPSMFDDL